MRTSTLVGQEELVSNKHEKHERDWRTKEQDWYKLESEHRHKNGKGGQQKHHVLEELSIITKSSSMAGEQRTYQELEGLSGVTKTTNVAGGSTHIRS